MSTLTLGQKILASTTLYLDNEVFKLHPTTLEDVFTVSYSKEKQIKLGKGNWGACPDRDRNKTVCNVNELRDFFDSNLKNKYDEGNFIYIVSNKWNFTIERLRYSHKLESLKDGNSTVYKGNYSSINLIDNKLKSNTSFDIEGAYKILEKYVDEYFKY